MPRTLIYSHTSLWPVHNAESVELAKAALGRGNDVYWLQCEGELASCPANGEHSLLACAECKVRSSLVRRDFLDESIHFETLRLSHVPVELEQVSAVQFLRDFCFDDAPLGELVLSQLVEATLDTIIPDSVVENQGRRLLQNAINLYQASLNFIHDRGIDEVYAWNGRRPSDGPVLWAAKKMGVDYYAHITGGSRTSLLVLPATKIHDRVASSEFREGLIADAKAELGTATVMAQGEEFFERNRNGTLDTIGYRHFRSARGSASSASRKASWVYFSNSPFERGFMSDWADGLIDARDQFDLLTKLHSLLPKDARMQFTVRWHPNLRNAGPGLRIALNQCVESTPDFYHVPPESDLDSHALMEEADVVVSNGSTMGIEATLFGKPSILAGVAGYSGMDGVYEVRSVSELSKLLQTPLSPKAADKAREYGWYLANFGNHVVTYSSWKDDNRVFVDGREFGRYQGLAKKKVRLLKRLRKAKLRLFTRLQKVQLVFGKE